DTKKPLAYEPRQGKSRTEGLFCAESALHRQDAVEVADLGDILHVLRQAAHLQALAGPAGVAQVGQQQRQADAAGLLHRRTVHHQLLGAARDDQAAPLLAQLRAAAVVEHAGQAQLAGRAFADAGGAGHSPDPSSCWPLAASLALATTWSQPEMVFSRSLRFF